MYLTRFRMNQKLRGTVRLVSSAHRMHAMVLGAFPPDKTQSPVGRVLWRLDTPSRYDWTLFIVSPARPSMERFQSMCGWSQEPSWQTADYGPFLDRLATGQRWAFRLTANPVRTVAREHGQRGKVLPHVTAEQQKGWLLERSSRYGFTLSDAHLEVTRRERDSFSRGSREHGRATATISRAQFDGVLEVVDPEVLRTSLTYGIGRAKAYGCGLMTLARSA